MTSVVLTPGTTLQDRYRIAEPLGRGGMGAVHLATDLKFGSTVALKETLCEGDELRRAFEREARFLNTLRHRALPVVIDYFVDSRGQFLVMQYIPGDDLGTLLAARRGAFDLATVLSWADELLDVLTYLHEYDPPIVHRDIKPRNLKLTPRGEIVLLDFGIAKSAPRDGGAEGASVSVLGYTAHYAPFEQIQGRGTDARSDLFALAATLYHLATGELPLDAVSRAMATMDGKPDPLRPASAVNPAVPPAVDAVLRQAMALSRDERPASAAAMRAALAAAASASAVRGATTVAAEATTHVQPALSGAPPIVTATPPDAGAARPRRTALWAAAAALVVVVAGFGVPRLTPLATSQTGRMTVDDRVDMSVVAPAEHTFTFAAASVAPDGTVGARSEHQARAFEEDLGHGVAIEMVAIPGGTFLMGNADASSAYADEAPQHEVRIPPFYLGRYEVTQAQWRAVATSMPRVRRDLEPEPSRFKGANLPVERVSWEDAVEFVERVARKAHRQYRLPSESEWEYAARAGTSTAFAFGEALSSELANYDATVPLAGEPRGLKRGETTPVGSFAVANGFGLADMHGNVMEWCAGEYHSGYDGAPVDGTSWVIGGDVERRVVRGGSWSSLAVDCRSANRYSYAQDGRRDTIGFRLAMTPPSAPAPRVAAAPSGAPRER